MKVLYCRVSTIEQKTDRQRVNESDYDLVVEDKCSGTIPFFERPGGCEILELIEQGILKSLFVWQIDRLGRDYRNILNTIHFFNEQGLPITFISQGLRTLDDDGKESTISRLVIGMVGIIGDINIRQGAENQAQGIRLAKLRGNVYTGRQKGSRETTLAFLSKEKNKKALDYLKKGYKISEVSKLTDLHLNTVSKVKRLGLNVV
jgi:DNA invertase Pin-like site-specific DNA recombinase